MSGGEGQATTLEKPVASGPVSEMSDLEAVREVARARERIVAEVRKRIVGQEEVVEHLLIAMFDAKKDGVVFGPSVRNDGYFVVRVAEVKSMPVDQNSEEYKQIRNSLGETLKLDIFAQYQTYLFDKYSVSRNQKLVDQMLSQMP